jgi:hypothetical protein
MGDCDYMEEDFYMAARIAWIWQVNSHFPESRAGNKSFEGVFWLKQSEKY